MSHASILVIGNNVEEAMAPYQENNMGTCPKKYMKFNDMEQEMRDEYENKKTELIKLADGTYHFTWDEMFVVKNSKKDVFANTEYKYPYNSIKDEFSFKCIYKTFEDYAKDYHGYDAPDKETGKYGYWENPNKKWDWYQVGGGFQGTFKLKEYKKRYSDSCKIEDIDMEGMRQEAKVKATKEYDKFVRLYGEEPTPLKYKWKNIIGMDKFSKLDIDEKRSFYHSQSQIKKLEKAIERLPKDMENEDRKFMVWVDYEDYAMTKDQYVEKAMDNSFQVFAFIKDGIWHERGELGWFGTVSDEKDKDVWSKEFTNMIKSLPGDTLVTMVDYHI